jgi:hypothetical protein
MRSRAQTWRSFFIAHVGAEGEMMLKLRDMDKSKTLDVNQTVEIRVTD